ncbi:MAG: ASKHA domain-containing protein, partial [Actinomycetota bacterium]
MTEHRVAFAPSGRSIHVVAGTTVLDAARTAGVDIDSTCGGRGLCGRCQIVPTDDAGLNGWTTVEEGYRGRRPLLDGHRLGCAAAICGDVTVDVPTASQVHQPVVTKSVGRGALDGVAIDPMVKLHYVELPPAELGAEIGGLREQITMALTADFGVTPTEIDAHVLAMLAPAVAAGGRTVTVAIRRGGTICGVHPGYADRALGIAVDVGSTTIAGHVVDLTDGEVLATAGRMNPQIRFGDDLMSRVSYVMMNEGGDVALTTTIREGLDDLVAELLASADATRHDVYDMVLVGNPVMHHVLLGIDPTPLGQAPFMLATDGPVTAPASAFDLDAPFAEVHLLPCIAGHVGADTAGAILAEGPHRTSELQLLVDVGTNAEIVLGDERRLFAASSPTGPAFEGAQISAGMRATAGAIERVRIDRDTLEPRLRVIGADAWSDEP